MISTNLNVCLLPLEITWFDKQKNLANLTDLFKRIHPETDVVILPETFSTGFPASDKQKVAELAEKNTGETIEYLKALSNQYNFAIAGSFIAETGGVYSNRAFFIDPGGDESFADKCHLFSPGGEDKILSKGYKRLQLRYRGWNISMAVCYDLRFPVWCRNVDNEYDLMIVVANWPISRIKVWDNLLVARALENQAYVCGVDCKGIDDKGNEYNGSSVIIDPMGRNISNQINEGPYIYATLSKEKLENFRNKFSVWKDSDKFNLL